MKFSFKLLFMLFVISASITLFSCKDSNSTEPVTAINPFSNGGSERNMIVVLSDIHLGADLAYAECEENLPALEKILKQIKASPNVKELVIAGDLIDEWFVPANVNTYQGKDQADFVQRIKTANKGVFDVMNSIIQEGNILLTYVPGNHDLTITSQNIELIFPGINQARDPELGIGSYSPAGCPKIIIEHGHRYNFFCAPDPYSNQDVAPGTIMPPGYFFTRLAALHVAQDYPDPGDTIKIVTPNSSGDESQHLLYKYYKTWEWAVNYLKITNKFDEKIFITNVDGFTDTYAVNDFVPYQTTPGGEIDVNLFKGIQDHWQQRQAYNHVQVDIPAARAIEYAASATELDEQARIQYFLNPNSDKRIVVFGHNHDAKLQTSNNHSGLKSIYANSGTWIDESPATTRTFVVITPQNDNPTSQTSVKIYNFENDIITKMAEDSVRY